MKSLQMTTMTGQQTTVFPLTHLPKIIKTGFGEVKIMKEFV
jgi:hypothetical protein